MSMYEADTRYHLIKGYVSREHITLETILMPVHTTAFRTIAPSLALVVDRLIDLIAFIRATVVQAIRHCKYAEAPASPSRSPYARIVPPHHITPEPP